MDFVWGMVSSNAAASASNTMLAMKNMKQLHQIRLLREQGKEDEAIALEEKIQKRNIDTNQRNTNMLFGILGFLLMFGIAYLCMAFFPPAAPYAFGALGVYIVGFIIYSWYNQYKTIKAAVRD
jgi:uncharacterized membrane protein